MIDAYFDLHCIFIPVGFSWAEEVTARGGWAEQTRSCCCELIQGGKISVSPIRPVLVAIWELEMS